MKGIFKEMDQQTKTFYSCALSLMLDDYKKNGMTINDAERLYDHWHIATIFKDGKIEFIVEE